MSILRHIRKVPLFSTPLEAMAWGRSRGLKGYHSHAFGVKTGYMGGANHREAMKFYLEPPFTEDYHTMPDGTLMKNSEMNAQPAPEVPVLQPIITQPAQNAPTQRVTPPSTGNTSSGSGGSGGGGGGY